jgi:hypothetical protein
VPLTINARTPMDAQNRTEALVRFPNESSYEKISIDLSEFTPSKSFEDETFGWYKGTYIALKK